MSSSPVTRPSLLLRLRSADDRFAWAEFVSLYAPLVYGYSRRAGLQDADAADLAQEVMLTVADQMRSWSYSPEKGSFRGWLFTIARNRVRNWQSSQNRHTSGTGDSGVHQQLQAVAAPDHEQTEWEAEYRRRVFHWAANKVRESVAPQTWRAFELTAVHQQNGQDVAERLGTTVAAVYLARSRVMARLRELVRTVDEQDVLM